MVEYPYILNTGKLKTFLESIPKMGVPNKITTNTLPQLGYKSKNDRPIVKILRFIGFIDENGVPTQNYINFRDTSKARIVMATAIRKAYSDLFQMYPDAYKKDDNTLKDFFRPTTKGGERVVDAMVDTFKTLCSFADFETTSGIKSEPEEVVTIEKIKEEKTLSSGITLNLTIQVVLPATEDATIYDKIFKSLKEHILSGGWRTS